MIREHRHLFRAPLLDSKQQVIGYKLAWQEKGQSCETADDTGSHQLLDFVAERVAEASAGLLFLDASPAVLSAQALKTIPPETAVLILKQRDLLDAAQVSLATSLRELGFGLALRDVDLAFLEASELLLSRVSYIFVSSGHPDLAAISSFSRCRQPRLSLVVDEIPDWQVFDASAGLGAYGMFENLCAAPRPAGSPVKLAPQARQILQLMQLVQGDADIRHLEKVLKSDVTLSYKLLRYINSAGFGLEVEIESPRHAVAMLGYAPLFRWLLLLLARTNTTGFSPALMQAAMVRGRFAELLGQGFLSRREAENLFVVGMFSFLDRLLGVPIQDVLGQLVLPEAVIQALLTRDGVYGPVLALAQACERDAGAAADLSAALSLTAAQVNQAHLSALAWAQNIKF